MKCPHCQFENRDEAEFCGECGKPLWQETTCPQCKTVNPPGRKFCDKCGHTLAEQSPTPTKPPSIAQPTSFSSGRYQVKKFLGEGGKKKVYLAYDNTLDRDVAFALIKTEKLDEIAKTRIKREARAMGKLGDHPNIVTVYDFGEHEGQPYMVIPNLPGGDVEGLIKKAPDHKLPLDKAIDIAKSVCKALEFAHAKGIIHRDIKPGNVLLSADGVAKVGDFGLAVAVELTRLTKSGMMVGTVAYMPPEQAMGGKVTAKADLYSLGAMLYEMVAGRPPFIGDDSVSIIGQHINTQPISPTWHRADLPPPLETLILQLLEKDPEKRPESPKVVLQALETIETDKTKKEPNKETTQAENPIYRRVFVGRESELKQLQNAFDSAMSGQGALMMVMGEPGIGKTALCYQLSTYVTLRGGKALVGHCYEEGSLSLSYLAFVEAMRSYVLNREIKDLREELGTGAADVARIVSEIRDRLKVKPRPQKDPEEERYRLMQAVTSFLTNAASVQPLLIVLEDLHDADKGTLDMLTHVSRHLTGTRLLVVGTFRDVEVDRSHPLSGALAELRRVSTYGRVLLRGLNPDEVRRMLETITQEEIPWNLAEAVHRQTEGNPLFVQEVVRFLVEEGLITQKEGRWKAAKDTPLEMNIPEGLRDVIGKRLSLLSAECNHLLSAASVIGREFDLKTLRTVVDIGENTFIEALKEAVQLSILEECSQVGQVRYRFTHAFFRQTLYEELIAPQRLQLHQQVARALEKQYEKRIDEHATELAEHFSQSTDPTDLKKAIEYSEMAAKRAADVYSFGEAVRLLEQAVNMQRVLDPYDKEKMLDPMIELCSYLPWTPGGTGRVLEKEAPFAFSLAESLGDRSKISRVCMTAIRAIVAGNPAFMGNAPQMTEWVDRADKYAEDNTIERAWANHFIGLLRCSSNDIRSGLDYLNQNLNLSRNLGAQDVYFASANLVLVFGRAPHRTGERKRLAEELWSIENINQNVITGQVGYTFFALGERNKAEKAWAMQKSIADKQGQIILEIMSRYNEATISYVDGRFEDALEIIADIRTRGEAGGMPGFTAIYSGTAEYKTRICLGKSIEELENNIQGNPFRMPELCLLLTHLGKNEEALEILDKEVIKRPGIGTTEDETAASNDIIFLEAAISIGDKSSAQLLYERFKSSGLASTCFYQTCVPRHLGGAAALLGRYDEARKHYEEAIKICTEMRFRPELALSKLQLAELLLEHYPDEKKEALEHLDFAIKEFREMKMQPSLERALRHKDILKA